MIAEAARFSDQEQRDHVAWGWLAERQPAEAAREILTAAERMSPLLRSVAVGVVQRLGEDALPAWRELAAAPRVGPHARAVLAAWDQGPEPSDADWHWLAVEAAAAALQDKGPDEALTRVWESMPGTDLDTCLAKVRATGHPDAAKLAQAVAEFAASGAPNSIDQVAELKVSLPGSRPLIWRRVRLPVTATLGDLHDAIQVLFGWDGDHLHVFQAGKKQYSDPFVNLDETGDEEAVRVRDAGTPAGRSATRTTSGPAGSTRSRWSRRCRVTPARTTRSAWRTRATPRSSTGPRTTPKNPSRSTWPRSTASWPRSARRRSEVALRAMNHDDHEPSLASLIERSAELKRALVDFALSPRFERHLERFMLEAADPYQDLSEGEAIGVIDRFALQHRLPNGKTVLDQFLASLPDLTAADREMLRGWRDPVEGIFEIRRKDRDSLVLLNLLDDLEYRAYSNMGPAAFRPLPKHGFVHARLMPIRPVPGAWLVSGSMSAYRKSGAAQIAQAALELATKLPELVYRNPEKIEQAWKQMREDRAAFVEFFGSDELVLPPAEAEERLNAYYRHRQEAALARQPARASAAERPRRGRARRRVPARTRRRRHHRHHLRRDRRAELLQRVRDAARPVRRPGSRGRQAVRGRAARIPAGGDDRPAAVPPPGRRPPGHRRRGVPQGPAQAELHLGRARRGPDAAPEALVLRARAPSRHLRDRRPPQRTPPPVDNDRIMDLHDREWGRKGATMSDKTARLEYGLTQDEIFAAIDAGKLQYRPAAMHGNPWLRLLRREVEDLARTLHGDRDLREQQARTELARINRELKQLRAQLAALEERRAALLSELGEQGSPRQ